MIKAQELYKLWLQKQPDPIPTEKRLKFTNPWLRDWMKEYGVSLRKPNKRYAIKQEERIERITEYLMNIWRIRKFFFEKYKKEIPIINGDQMPLHRNESSGQRSLNLKNMDCFVKENYALSRERITCYTQFASDDGINLQPEFVFKGKGNEELAFWHIH